MFKKLGSNCCFMLEKLINAITLAADFLANFFALALRWILLQDFTVKSGMLKFHDMSTTIALFQNEYHVAWLPLPPAIIEKFGLVIPQLPPVFAAYSGTFVEIVFPALLLLGIGGRIPAIVLFVFNYFALMSYPVLWQTGWEAAFKDHIIWGVMSATLVFYGVGKISVDAALKKMLCSNYKY